MLRLPKPPYAALGPILFGSVLILLLFSRSPQPQPHIAPAWALDPMPAAERLLPPGVPTPTPQPLDGRYTRRNELDMVVAEGLYSAEQQGRLAVELERALNYVSNRFGAGPSGRIEAFLGWEPGCGLHGIAYTARRTVQVFTCPDIPLDRAVNILAHEFVHQLAQDYYGPAHPGSVDLILLEGIATWGAGDYWLAGRPDFAAFSREYAAGGRLLPLASSYVGRPMAEMNQLYYQWASFVEFLIGTYGRASFDALYVSGNPNPGSADYQRIYGKDLATLEAEWRTRIRMPDTAE